MSGNYSTNPLIKRDYGSIFKFIDNGGLFTWNILEEVSIIGGAYVGSLEWQFNCRQYMIDSLYYLKIYLLIIDVDEIF